MATDGFYDHLSEVSSGPLEVCQPVKHEASHDAFAQEQLAGLRALARLSATVTDHHNWAPQAARAGRPDEARHESRRHAAHAAGSARDTGGFLHSEFLRRDRDWDPPLLRHARPATEF
jgi:hypothetical protein